METKKNRTADLERSSKLFFSVGLLVALSITITAFEWRQYDDGLVVIPAKNFDAFPDLIDVPPTEIPIPKAPVPLPIVVIVPDHVKVETVPTIDAESTEQTEIPDIILPVDPPNEETEDPFIWVEESATPKGGLAAFYKFVSDKIKYPPQARRMGIEGKVYVEFIIGKDGSLSGVRTIKGIGAGCDEEAVRIIQSAPPWNPGKQRGKPVKQRYTLPIHFKLG